MRHIFSATIISLLWALPLASISADIPVLLKNDNITPAANLPASDLSGSATVKIPFDEVFKHDKFTLGFRVQPLNWDSSENKWHFLLSTDNFAGSKPYFGLYLQLNGTLRLIYFKEKTLATEIAAPPVNWKSGDWHHVAFTYENLPGNKAKITLYLDGIKIKSQYPTFQMKNVTDRPKTLLVGDIPYWNPKSSGKTRFGEITLYDRVLSDSEMASWGAPLQNGNRTITSKEFMPNTQCGMTGVFFSPNPSELPKVEVSFFDELNQKIPASQVPELTWEKYLNSHKFTLKFTPPEKTFFTQIQWNSANSDKVPFYQIFSHNYGTVIPDVGHYYWQGYWIWGDNEFVDNAHCYFKKTFQIKDVSQLSSAVAQWVCDNGAELFINSKSIGKVGSWAVPKVAENLQSLLKDGENTIEVNAFNLSSDAGFLAELNLVYKDGSTQDIFTDSSWLFSTSADKTHLFNSNVKCKPPQNPYGKISYVYSGKKYPITIKDNSPEVTNLKSGDKLNLEFEIQSDTNLPQDNAVLTLYRNNTEIVRFPTKITRHEKSITLTCQEVIPYNIKGGIFSIHLDSSIYKLDSADNFIKTIKINGKKSETPLIAKVKPHLGAPRLFINGKITPPDFYRTSGNARNQTASLRFTKRFSEEIGIDIYELSLTISKLLNRDGSINTEYFDNYLDALLFYTGNAKVVLFLNLDAPKWYLEQNPEEQVQFSDQRKYHQVSFASVKWQKQVEKTLADMLEYLKKQNYYNSILGFGFDCGEDGQWMQWTTPIISAGLGDYSDNMKRYFADFLTQKYGDIKKLNQIYNTSYADFSAVPLPDKAARSKSAYGFFLNPANQSNVIDYQQAFSQVVADKLLRYAALTKKITNHEKLVAAYYGKFFTIAGYNEWGEFSILDILKSPDIDYLIAVSYNERSAGKPHSSAGVLGSYQLHNKIYIDEADLRTYLGGTRGWGYSGAPADTAAMIRKMFAMFFTKNHGIHWYDLFGGIFDDQGIANSISNVAKIAEKHAEAPASFGDVAVIVDEKSMLYTTSNIKTLTRATLANQQNGNLYRMGSDFDLYFLDDMNQAQMPNYKMYIFLNAWSWSDANLKWLESIKKDGKMLVFLYNSGLIANGKLDKSNVEKLTGISMGLIEPEINLAMQISPQDSSPLFKNVKNGVVGAGRAAYTVYPVGGANTVVAGKLLQRSEPAMALRTAQNYQVFYSAVPVLSPEIFRELAKMAKCHIYSDDSECIVYAGSNLWGVYSAKGGNYTVNMKQKATYIDLISGKILAVNSNQIKLNMPENQTIIIGIKP